MKLNVIEEYLQMEEQILQILFRERLCPVLAGMDAKEGDWRRGLILLARACMEDAECRKKYVYRDLCQTVSDGDLNSLSIESLDITTLSELLTNNRLGKTAMGTPSRYRSRISSMQDDRNSYMHLSLTQKRNMSDEEAEKYIAKIEVHCSDLIEHIQGAWNGSENLYQRFSSESRGRIDDIWVKLAVSRSKAMADMLRDDIAANEGLHLGQTVELGSYPGTAEGINMPVCWEVIDLQEDKAVMICKKGLIFSRYHGSDSGCVWESSDLRQWLNGIFLQKAFSDEERRRLISCKIMNHSNNYGIDGGPDTEDMVWLLSEEEAGRYFETDESRRCIASDFARGQGTYVWSDGSASWWLRTPGINDRWAAVVYWNGEIRQFGESIGSVNCLVRPVICVKRFSIFQ